MFRPDPKPNLAAERIQRKTARLKDKAAIHRDHALFYKKIWQLHKHFCFECGEHLPVFDKSLVHHIIHKAQQKRYGISLDQTFNGILLCLAHHDQAHLNIDKTPKVKALTARTEKEYEKFKIKS